MDSSVKRIGDVTIERVISDKKDAILRGEKTMNSESDSDSESLSSEEDLLLTEGSPSIELSSKSTVQNLQASVNISSSKRKNDFESESSQAKKVKNQLNPVSGESDSEINTVNSEINPSVNQNTVSDTNVDQTLIASSLQSENEDSEYDSDDESDMEDATQKLDDRVPILDSEKSDFIEKLASSLGETSSQKSDEKIDSSDYDYDITEKLKEMGEISVETVKKGEKPRKIENPETPESEISLTPAKKDSGSDSEDKNSSERKIGNMRRNIREVMDETQLDEATLAAQRQEMERLRRVQEQQKIIREVQRQIALNRQNNKTQHRVISLLQGNNSIIKQMPGTSGSTANRIGGTVLVKLPNGETKPMTRITKGQTPFELVRLQKGAVQGKVGKNFVPIKKTAGGNLTPSVSIAPVAKKIEPKTGSDSETETSDSEKKMRKVAGKPKDVVTISSSSDDDCIVLSEDEAEEPEPEEDPCNSGMHTNDAYNVPDEQGRVLINVGHPENESDIFLAPQIARVIKPHQIGGVRFLYDNVIESIDRFSTSTGFGCILAHSMGLGKTLQVVCFSDIFLRHTPAKTILCIMPINTLQNWMAEFNMWLPKDIVNSPLLSHGEVRPRNFNLFVLNDSHKTLAARAKVIQEWHKDGGVLLIGYELYRLLSLRRNPKSKSKRNKKANPTPDPETPEDEEKNKSLFEEIHEALVKPGPDLVICDEGHRIKNSHASISQALKQIRSKRRIVLTGYPLQNNLLEYWCMVDFVRPNYLGTKTEFSNMFERPIQNGQCIDSTPQDIRLMRYRAHVLHSLLEGFVQRRSHAVLQTSLPQKEEYVLLVRMTDFQRKLYDTFMNEVVRTKTVPNPLKAFAVCCKIWNHPDVLYYFLKKHTSGEAVDIDLEEVAGTTPGTTTTSTTPKKGSSRAKGGSKKEKKSAASKSNASSPNSTKPAASVTPSTNTTTSPSNTTTSSNSGSAPANVPPPMNIPNPSMSNPSTPALPNPPNYHQPNQNYPMPPYPNSHLPYPHQNYGNYPNGDYYNQNYPNYNQHYYPNQDYSGFYDNTKQENYPGGYPPENQNYWNQGNQNQYYNQNNQEYYNNMPPGYDNQHYYRQNEYPAQSYGQNVYPAPNYGSNWPQPAPSSDTYKPNPDFKPTEFGNKSPFKSEFSNSEFKPEFKSSDFKPEEKMDKLKLDEPIEIDECKPLGENADDEKKSDSSVVEVKDESDEKQDKDGELKGVDPAGNLAKINSKEDPGIPYDWATELMKGYTPGCIENSAKMEIFFCILQESMALGDRILLFSQSLFTLNLIEEFLQKCEVPGSDDKWARNKHYYRLDGSTSALEREKLINEYNSNPNIHLFLVSTRAGSLGINLVGANRVIVFDASWNPCHDTQAVCRVYRYGQKKPCFVYRIVMDNCLEKKIYDRQINKQGMADRVVDECNPDAHLSMKDVTNLCWDDEKDSEVKDFSTNKDKYIDVVMQKVLDAYSSRLSKEPFQHESLLIDRKEKKLSQAEKRLAKRSYELEKQANINSRPAYSYYNNGSGQGLQIRAIRTQDGVLQNKPVASVRPMQSEQMVRDLNRPGSASPGRSRWIPAEVWQRQGMTAQEMTLPLDVVIPTNSPDRGSIVLKAGQKVLVLKSPKGIYMQLECGKIVAIKTAFKVRGGKAPEKGEEGNNKDAPPTTILKKVPQVPNSSKTPPATVPLPLKNNSAITVIPKAGQQRIVKPFTQSVTKLNMRTIRQPVPNLVGRQVPMRLNNPKFTGKIQSMNRKVQLAKAKPYNLDKIGDSPKPMDPSVIKMEPPDLDTETHVVQSSDEDIPMDGQVEHADKKDDSSDSGRFGNNEIYSSSEKSMEATSDIERMSNNEYGEPGMHRRPSTDSFTSGGKVSDSYSNLEYPSDRYQNMDYPPTLDKYPAMDSYHSSRFNQSGNESYQGPPSLEKFGDSPSYGVPPSGKYPNAATYQPMEGFQNVEYPKPEKYQNLDKPKRSSSTNKDDKSASATGNDSNTTEPPSPFSPTNSQNVSNQLASGSVQFPPNSTGQSPQAPSQYNQLSPSSNQVPPSPSPITPQPDASSNQNAPTPTPFLPSTNQFQPNSNQNQSAPVANQIPAPPANQTPSHAPLANHNQLAPHANQIPPNTPQLTIPAPQPHPKEVEKVKPPTSFGMNPISNYNPSNYTGPIYQSTASQPPVSVHQNLPPNTSSFNQTGVNLHQNQPPSNLHASTNLHQGNMHQQTSNLHQSSPNFHQNSANLHQNPSNLHQSSTNLHQNSSNMHQNPTTMQHNPASHPTAPGMHQNAAATQQNTGTGNILQPQSNLQQNSTSTQQNSSNLHQNSTNLHQNPSNINLHQNASNMHSNSSNLHQNSSNVHQNPQNLHQNTTNMHQNPPSLHPNASNLHQSVTNVHQNTSNLHQNPSNLHQNTTGVHPNTTNLHQSTSNLHQNTSNLHQNAQNLHQNTANLHQNNSNMHQNTSNMHQASSNLHQNTSNVHQNQPNLLQNQGNMHQSTGNLHQNSSNLHQNQTNLHQNSANLHPGASNVHSNTSNMHQSTSNLHQNSSNLHQNTSNLHQNNVNMHQNTSNLHQNTSNLHTNNSNVQQPANMHPNTTNLHQNSANMHTSATNLQQTSNLHQNTSNLQSSAGLHQSPPNLQQNAAGMHQNMLPNTMNLHQQNVHQSLPATHQNVHGGNTTHPGPTANLNIHQTNTNMHQNSGNLHQGTTLHQSSANATNMHQTSPTLTQNASSIRQVNTTPVSSHPATSLASSNHPNTVQAPSSGQNLHSYQSAPIVSQSGSAGSNLHVSATNIHQSGTNLHSSGAGLQPVGSGVAPPHGTQMHGGHHQSHLHSSNHGAPPLAPPSGNLLQIGHQPSNPHQNLHHHQPISTPQPAPNLHQNIHPAPNPPPVQPPQPTPTTTSQTSTSGPQPSQSSTNPPPVEQGNTNRSLKNYRHNFASQKNHGNFSKNHKPATSSALHQLEQATSAIGENKQAFQESLDSITNSYGAVPPTDANKPEETHIIDLDNDKLEEIPEKTPKTSLKPNQPASGEKQSTSQPPATPNTKPETIQQPLPQPQDYGYGGYYGYNPHLQGYPQAQPLIPPQNYYGAPEPQLFNEQKQKTEKPLASTSTTTTTTNSTTTTDTTVPSQNASYTSAPAGFGHYAQPGLPPPPPHPHGTYDMMYPPQQNQYSSTYPGLPYPNQPYAPYQPTYETPPQGNMYSAFHRPDLHPPHAYADPYGGAPYMRAGYPLPAPPPTTVAGAPAPPPPATGAPPPAHPHVGQYAPYGAQYPPPPPPPPGYDYQYGAHPPAPPFVTGLN